MNADYDSRFAALSLFGLYRVMRQPAAESRGFLFKQILTVRHVYDGEGFTLLMRGNINADGLLTLRGIRKRQGYDFFFFHGVVLLSVRTEIQPDTDYQYDSTTK